MHDPFTPTLSYEFAWQYVQLYNALPWEDRGAYRSPINLADIYTVIGDYLKQRADFVYRKVTFHEFLFKRVSKIRADRDAPVACEPRDGLHEFRIMQIADGPPWLLFPADSNSGWQSLDYLAVLRRNTLFHGYVVQRDQAIRLHDFMVYWQDALSVLRALEPRSSKPRVTECYDVIDRQIVDRLEHALKAFRSRHPYA